MPPMPELEHRAMAKRVDTWIEELVQLHASLRSSQLPAHRTRLDCSKAIAALKSFRLSMVGQLKVETADAAREAYFR